MGYEKWPEDEFHLIYSHADSESPYYADKTQHGTFGPLPLVPGPLESEHPHPARSAQPGEVWRFDTEFGYRSCTYEYVGRFVVTRRFYDPETGKGSVELHEVTAAQQEYAQRIAEHVKGLVAETGHTSADVARAIRCDVEEAEHVLNGTLEFTVRHMLAISNAIGVPLTRMFPDEVKH